MLQELDNFYKVKSQQFEMAGDGDNWTYIISQQKLLLTYLAA